MLQPNRTPIVAAVLYLAIATWGPVARADDWATAVDRPGPQFELYLSSLFASSVSEGSFGLRGAFFLGKRFALEGSLSRIADSRLNILLADASAKFYLKHRGRARVYLTGGPGLFLSDDLDASELMLHLGFGTEFGIGRKFYLRPELRGRWLAEDVSANFGELSLGFGWRF